MLPPPRRKLSNVVATNQLLPYHGGKWLLAPWIISNMPKHKIYVEPFCGGGSVLLQKYRAEKYDVYNDLAKDAVNLFKVMRDDGRNLLEQLRLTPFSRDEYELAFVDCPQNPVEWARRIIIRSRMGFGCFATHGKKSGFKAYSSPDIRIPASIVWKDISLNFVSAMERLRGVVIENRDCFEIIAQQDTEHTLFYLDPPYMEETRKAFGVYRHEVDNDFQKKLGDVLNEIKGSAVISGYESPLYNKMFKHWKKVTTETVNNENNKRVEVLWIKGDLPQRELL